MTAAAKAGSSLLKDYASRVFLDRYGAPAEIVAAAPGRVNLIGEHTDYNDGFVLPMSIDKEITVAASRRRDRRLRIFSPDFGQELVLDLGSLKPAPEAHWSNYVAGVYWALKKEGYNVLGADLVIAGDLPKGVGLSSSAALELSTARAACAMGGWAWDAVAMALLAQKAESEFVGVKCGLMDQMAVAACESRSALFFDCRSLATRSIPVAFLDAEFVLIDSTVKRNLINSGYNTRRTQCDQAVENLKLLDSGIQSLRDADPALLAKAGDDESIWMRRARHVVTENKRVLKAVLALEGKDSTGFGKLMNESHDSLRNDYEVSCHELDVLVEAARNCGALGARLTGAGFGGCTINLVPNRLARNFGVLVRAAYQSACGREAQVITVSPGEAARLT